MTQIEQFEVRNRWTGAVAFTAQIDVTPGMSRGWKLRLAVAWALAASIACSDLDLDGADFTGYECPAGSRFVRSRFVDSRFDDSSFDDSSFVRSSFDDSSFVDSSFVDSSFDGSSFVGSSFVRSRFDGSSFVRSRFVRSRFDDSSFDGSRFVGSSFVDSSFVGSSFVDSSFVRSRFVGSRFVDSSFVDSSFVGESQAQADFNKILDWAQPEVPGLIAALREGRVNGSTYSGACACLVGTIANVRGCDVSALECDSGRPAERWFMMICTGDKPGDSSPGGYASAKALAWAEDYCRINGIELPEVEAA